QQCGVEGAPGSSSSLRLLRLGNVNSSRLVFRNRHRIFAVELGQYLRGNSMKFATVALAFLLAFDSSLASAQIDSRVNSNASSATNFSTGSSSAYGSSSSIWPDSS